MAGKKVTKVNSSIQDYFITRLKQLLPSGIGMAEELADILEVSIDSAYRRIRGETGLTLDEIYKISRKYTISVDEIFGNQSDTVTFAYTKLTDNPKNFEDYLGRIISHLRSISKFGNGKIFYVAEEMPLFYSFFSKKLTEFKLFYWQRSVLNIPDYQNIKFDWGIIPEKMVESAHDSFKEYLSIPSSEVWSDDTVFTGLRQIKFYFDSGIITKTQALELLQDYRKSIDMVHKNAESGRKNVSDKTETYALYNSEIMLGTNCIYITMGDLKYSYISFNTMNSLTTNNPEFCEEIEHWIKNLEKKSTLISGVGEKQRYQFFSKMYKNIDDFIKNISQE
jgi:BetR domain